MANAVAGAAALSKFGGYDTSMRWVSGDDDSDAAWQRVRLQAFINSGGTNPTMTEYCVFALMQGSRSVDTVPTRSSRALANCA